MPGNFQSASPGVPFRPTASQINAWNAAAQAQAGPDAGGGGGLAGVIPATTLIYIKNASGADVGRFCPLGVDAPLFDSSSDDFKNRLMLSCVTPELAGSSTHGHTGRFVVTAQPIKNGKIGLAFIAGAFPAQVEIVTAGDGFADVKASHAELKSGSSGAAQILWPVTGTGSKLCIVRMGGGGSGGGIVTPVSVTKDGGSLGVDGVSACNATYTVKSADGSITYGATKQVTKPDGSTASKALFRGLKVALQSGTYGFAILNSDNTVKALLVVLDEVPVTESDCT
jgi:hypothetical protein